MELPLLTADCSRCFALCCVLVPYERGPDFAADKPSGIPCSHLGDDDRCRIHEHLTERGWSGCVRFDCFGAGQQVSQVTYAGTSWREVPNRSEMSAVLSVMRQLHEMLALLEEARRRTDVAAEEIMAEVLALTGATPEQLLAELDVDEVRARVAVVLTDASARVRAAWPDGAELSRVDLSGADLRQRDLRGAHLRGALLIGADLRGVDLTGADLLGADVRGARVQGAQLDGALFLTTVQRAGMRPD